MPNTQKAGAIVSHIRATARCDVIEWVCDGGYVYDSPTVIDMSILLEENRVRGGRRVATSARFGIRDGSDVSQERNMTAAQELSRFFINKFSYYTIHEIVTALGAQ